MRGRLVFAVVAAAILFAPDFALAQVTVNERLAPGQSPLIVAHRAKGGGFPENSLAGIQNALDLGVDMVKIDTQLTRDGRYILMHDPTLNRTTDVEAVYPAGPPNGPTRETSGGADYIRDYTLEEIKRLRLLDGSSGGDHAVPTLEEALDLVDGRLLVALDLKVYEIESIAALLNRRDTEHLLLFGFYYFDPRVLLDVSTVTDIRTSVTMPRARDYLVDLDSLFAAQGSQLAMISVTSKNLSPELVAKAEELGVALSVGPDGGEDSALLHEADAGPWLRTLNNGAKAFVTGHPAALLELLNR